MLSPLFDPEIIAVVGASRTPGKVGNLMLANLIDGGYKGTLVPINPSAEKILGIQSYKNFADYGGTIDLSLIIVPQPLVKEMVRASIEAGAKAVSIISVGFKEATEEGALLEHQIAELCKLRNVRLLGPNCLGHINTANHLNAFYAVQMPRQGGISMISQSSAICSAFLARLANSKLGVSKFINIGNKADITEIDLLRSLADDAQTKVIVGYLESISSGDAFVKAAEEASIQKPVVILKAATTVAGRKAVAAHSGEILGTDTAYGAAFKRAGVVRADTFGALFDIAAAFSLQPLPKGDRVLVITNAGGLGIMAVDAIERSGLQVAYLDPKNATSLRQELTPSATIYNPLDLVGDAGPQRYADALKTAFADPHIDAIIVIFVSRVTSEPEATAKAIAASCAGQEKPVIVSFIGEGHQEARAHLKEGGVPDFDSPEHAVAAIKAMCEYVAWQQRPPRVVTRFKVNRRKVERVITRKMRSNHLVIREIKAKDILEAYDFQVPKGQLVNSVDEAFEAAQRIGYPVALKIVSPDILHKKDIGAVRLNIANRDGIRDAFDLIMLRARQYRPDAHIEGVYVEKMLERGLEVILGMKRDPQFGPMLMFGLGGIFIEILKDVAFHLAPITFEEAIQMLKSTKSYQILIGTRGEKGVDLHVIAKCLQKISQLATDFPHISELEINPLIVGDKGTEPFVADARIILKAQEQLS